MTTARRLTVLAALLIVTGGYVHFCLYRHGYRFIPTIGISFLLQFTSSALLAGALLVTDLGLVPGWSVSGVQCHPHPSGWQPGAGVRASRRLR